MFEKNIVKQGYVTINKKEQTFTLSKAIKGLKKKKNLFSMAVSLYALPFTVAKGIIDKKANSGPFKFSDLIGCELMIDDNSVSEVTVGKGAGVGVDMGLGIGIGSFAHASTSQKYISSMYVRADFDNLDCPCLFIPFITKRTKTDSKEYKRAYEGAYKTLVALRLIMSRSEDLEKLENDTTNYDEEEGNTTTLDPVEEIKKYKNLLDDGVITEEEFNQKKKELLNL